MHTHVFSLCIFAELPGAEIRKNVIAFYSEECFLSTLYKSCFHLNGKMYNSVEQYYTEQKALFQYRSDLIETIMSCSPLSIRDIRETVLADVSPEWEAKRIPIMAKGNQAKFTQHSAYLNMLLDTGNKTLLYVHPYYSTWGSGTAIEDKSTFTGWLKGQNMLGIILMGIRRTEQNNRKSFNRK